MEANPPTDLFAVVRALFDGSRTPADVVGVPDDVVQGAYELGRGAYAAERYVQAEAFFVRCVLLESTNGAYWFALAAALHAQGQLDLARHHYRFAALLGAPGAADVAEALS